MVLRVIWESVGIFEMKIAFFTQNMAPFRMKWMDEIAKYHEVHIFHLDEYEAGLNKKYIDYMPERAIVHCAKKEILGRHLYDRKSVLKEKADVVILDGYGFIGQQHLIMRLHSKKIKFIISVDGGFVDPKESTFKRIIKTFFISKASGYFSTSRETDNFICHYGGKKGQIFRHYFSNLRRGDVEDKAPAFEEKLRIRQELGIDAKNLVITVGKFEPRKGFDLLLEALNDISQDVCLCLIGSTDSEIYKDYITESNKDKIKFIGFCNQEELKIYYRAADLMILPTRRDEWGLVISEAMASGIPVVTTNMCLAGKAMLDPDEIIPANSVEAVHDSLQKYIEMPEFEKDVIGNRNIDKVQKYVIESSAVTDIKSLEKFVAMH